MMIWKKKRKKRINYHRYEIKNSIQENTQVQTVNAYASILQLYWKRREEKECHHDHLPYLLLYKAYIFSPQNCKSESLA